MFFGCGDCSLEFDLRAKAFEIAVNDSVGQFFACTQIRNCTVSRVKLPVDLHPIVRHAREMEEIRLIVD
jgi:hypothetical protein